MNDTTGMLGFSKTEASVQKLLDLLRCDNCERTLHTPFTTGVCAHTLCIECCSVSRLKKKDVGGGNVCPICLIPIRPCDVKPHPQLSSLVLVARRLAKLLLLPSSSIDVLLTEAEANVEDMGLDLMENKENFASKDNIDFINTDAYCRVESPCPSSDSRSDPKTSPLPPQTTITTTSPIACSVKLAAQYTGDKEGISDEPLSPISSSFTPKSKGYLRQSLVLDDVTTNMSPTLLVEDSTEKSSRTGRRGSRRLVKKQSDPHQSPPVNRLLSTLKQEAIAPLATPEHSCLTENSLILNVAKKPERSPLSKKRTSNVRQTSKAAGQPQKNIVMRRKQVTNLGKSPPGSVVQQNPLRLNSKGESALHRAAIKNDTVQLTQLLASGFSANVRDHAGWTPLHEAALRGHVEAVECLLKGGATADLPGGPDLETPLHEAVGNSHLACVRTLLLTGSANPDFANGAGLSPLQVCVRLLEKVKSASAISGGRNMSAVKLKTTVPTLTSIHTLLLKASASSHTVKHSYGGDVKDPSFTDNSVVNLSASALFIERRRLRPVLLGTGLNRIQKSQLVRVARLVQARVANEMSSEVTHLITGATSNPSETKKGTLSKNKQVDVPSTSASPTGLTCPRTLKFLFAVLQGCWVLSFDWVETCSLVKMRVEEEGFEVSGCSTAPTSGASRLARNAREAGSAGLFHGFRICLLGNFEYPTPGRSDLSNLATAGGAAVFTREISSASRLASLAIGDDPVNSAYCLIEDAGNPSQLISTTYSELSDSVTTDQLIALYDLRGSVTSIAEYMQPEQLVRSALDKLRLKERLTSSHVPPPLPIRLLPATWLMDCVANYSILPAPKKQL